VKAVVHAAADAKLAEAVAYYTAIDATLGQRFFLEIKRLLREVCAHPRMFRQFNPPARRHFSPSFLFGVIYLESTDHLWIVAMMHMKRNPGYGSHESGLSG
jgi:toxin ParE1/3/4